MGNVTEEILKRVQEWLILKKKSEIGVTEGFFSSHVPESQFSSCVLSRNHPSP